MKRGLCWRRCSVLLLCLPIVCLAAWVGCGAWPDPKTEPLPWQPDAIVILGGGDEARSRKGFELAQAFPEAALLVTGDGGLIVRYLTGKGIPPQRIRHDEAATSTMENALFTDPVLDGLNSQHAVLVTNSFHVPRSLAIFRSIQPEREWCVAFEPSPDPLTPWDQGCRRRERLAALHHFLRYGLWCF